MRVNIGLIFYGTFASILFTSSTENAHIVCVRILPSKPVAKAQAKITTIVEAIRSIAPLAPRFSYQPHFDRPNVHKPVAGLSYRFSRICLHNGIEGVGGPSIHAPTVFTWPDVLTNLRTGLLDGSFLQGQVTWSCLAVMWNSMVLLIWLLCIFPQPNLVSYSLFTSSHFCLLAVIPHLQQPNHSSSNCTSLHFSHFSC